MTAIRSKGGNPQCENASIKVVVNLGSRALDILDIYNFTPHDMWCFHSYSLHALNQLNCSIVTFSMAFQHFEETKMYQ